MSTPPPGWYPDPSGGPSRWWDGQQWHAAPPGAQPAQPQSPYQQPQSPYQQPQSPYQQPQFHQAPPAGWRPGAPVTSSPVTGSPMPDVQPLDLTEVPTGRRWVVPVVVVGALATIVGVYAAAGMSTDRMEGQDARAAVQLLTDSMADGDCRGVQEATSQAYWSENGFTCAAVTESAEYLESAGTVFDVGTADVDGDSATVPMTVREGGETDEVVFELARQGGTWVVTGER